MKRSFGTLALLPLSLAGIAVGSYSAQAANINPAGVPCFTCIQGSNNSPSSFVSVSIATNGPGGADDTVTFNFVPVIGLNNTPNFNITGASDAFAGFTGNGIISDVVALPLIFPVDPFSGPPLPVNPFIVLDPGAADGEDFFVAESMSQPLFQNIGPSSVFFTSLTGKWFSGDGTSYNGGVTLSATFDGRSTAQVIADASDGTPVNTSWSFTGSITPHVDVPEPSLVSSLAIVAGSAFLLRGKKEQH
jgi:hypothetical protein